MGQYRWLSIYLGKYFLNKPQKEETIKVKDDKFDQIEMKNISTLKYQEESQ
jgi:hypothetical protein